MNTIPDTSDERLLDLLRLRGPLGILQMAEDTGVTSTAVRQRLSRLMDRGLVQREASPRGRGRPSHRYSLTEKARRQAGSNFADLAIVLWNEVRGVKDPEIRRGLLARIAEAMAAMYKHEVQGETAAERVESLVHLFAERRVPMELSADGKLPVLSVKDCPYPELAARDRSICAVEKMLFSRLLEQDVRLSECRFEGHGCCQFVASDVALATAGS
jgi:predicted ArsR family transcriptional regulator